MKRVLIAVLLVLALAGGVVALAAAGGADDPLVSLSYLLGTFRDGLLDRAGTAAGSGLQTALKGADTRLKALESAALPAGAEGATFAPVSLERGARLELPALSVFMPTAGSARLSLRSGERIDLSAGTTVADGSLLTAYHRYLAAENASALIKAEGGALSGMAEGPYSLLEPEPMTIEELFPDLRGHWGASYVNTLYRRQIVNGVAEGVFSPNGTVTRAMLVTILGRVDGVQPENWGSPAFSDVNASAWYGPYVAWAESRGIVLGYEDGTFRPNAPVTREQMALIFMRYASSREIVLGETETAPFADADSVSPWARDAVDFARLTGLMNGKSNNRFDPRGTATRAEICAVTARFLEKALL